MKMGSAAEIVQVEVSKLQVQSGPQIGKNLASLGKRKDHSDPRGLARKDFDPRNIDPTL